MRDWWCPWYPPRSACLQLGAGVLLLSALALSPRSSSAQPPTKAPDPYAGLDHAGTPPPPPLESRPPPGSVVLRSDRPLPDYDRRPDEGLGAGDVLIWVPRTIFLPVHLVLDYLVRWPLVSLVTLMEKHHVIERVSELVTFSDGRGGRGVVLPTFFWDFNTQTTVGLLVTYSDIAGSRHDVGASVAYWPESTTQASLGDAFSVFSDRSGTVALRASYIDRRDFRFFGLGPFSAQGDETFFRKRQFEAETSLRAALSGLNRVGLGLFYRTAKISGSDERGPSLEQVFQVGDPEVVPGWEEPFHLLELQTRLELDTRNPERVYAPGSGVRLDVFGSFSVAPHRPELNFFKWGGEADAFWDVSGNNNVLALRLYAAVLEATGDEPVPFVERLQLGGDELLRGFSIGRFHGDSALVATASYRYPIWLLLDADLFVTVGNAFDGRFERLHVKRLVMNWGFALRTSTSRVRSFDLILAFGTNRFEQWDDEFELDNIRFTFAVNQGF